MRFLVADIASFEDEEGFDLTVMLNMPPFFDRVIALLRPEGFVVNASSFGSRTPFFTPPALLERGFERRGVRTVAVGQVGLGTYYLARRVAGPAARSDRLPLRAVDPERSPPAPVPLRLARAGTSLSPCPATARSSGGLPRSAGNPPELRMEWRYKY